MIVPITSRFRATVAARGDSVAMRSRSLHPAHPEPHAEAHSESHPHGGAEGWGALTWPQYSHLVDQAAAAFISWGVAAGDRVAVLANNRWEWHVADLGALMAGAVSVPIYPTSSPSQVSYILSHSGCTVCVAEDAGQLAKVTAAAPQCPDLQRVILFGSEPTEDAGTGLQVMAWSSLLAVGAAALEADPTSVDRRSAAIAGDDIATIVYTSGTTGPPKGVVLTHANISATVDMILQVVPVGPQDRMLSFLPLSHIAERVTSHFGQVATGAETWFARSISTLAQDMLACRPTIMFAVPRVWEKARASLEIELAKTHGAPRRLADRYRTLSLARLDRVDPDGRDHHHDQPTEHHHGESRFPLVAAAELAGLDRIVGHKILHGMGLDQAHALFSGAAAIDPSLLRWLAGAGVHVGEVYGQTEVCGPTTITPPKHIRIGTVGPPLPGMGVRIADDGEIMVRGANVCRGYFRNDEATAALFDAEGWMHTGDLGSLDPDGYLRITGRKKDLMKTAGGKYIAPQELELRLRSCRFVSNAVVVAEGRPYVTALLTLDAEAVSPWAVHRGKPASLEALAADPDVLHQIAEQVEQVNRDMSHAETVKRWRVLPRDLTLDAGELTPTLKVVRTVVLDHFRDAVEQLYARPDTRSDAGTDTPPDAPPGTPGTTASG